MKLERTLPLLIKARAEAMPQIIIQLSKDESGKFVPKTYEAFFKEVQITAAGLLELGEKRGSHIGIISDNRQEWLVTDIAVLSIGAADVPRGCDSPDKEIAYILGFSECTLSFAENTKQAEKILSQRDQMPLLKTLVVYDRFDENLKAKSAAKGVSLLHFPNCRNLARNGMIKIPMKSIKEIEKASGMIWLLLFLLREPPVNQRASC